MKLPAALAALALLALPALAGAVHEVAIVDNSYEPAVLAVAVGDTVVWTNTGQFDHTVTSFEGTFYSGIVPPGGSFAHTFTAPGVHVYRCDLHFGQQGVVVVAA